jgi:hypothetical protein
MLVICVGLGLFFAVQHRQAEKEEDLGRAARENLKIVQDTIKCDAECKEKEDKAIRCVQRVLSRTMNSDFWNSKYQTEKQRNRAYLRILDRAEKKCGFDKLDQSHFGKW